MTNIYCPIDSCRYNVTCNDPDLCECNLGLVEFSEIKHNEETGNPGLICLSYEEINPDPLGYEKYENSRGE